MAKIVKRTIGTGDTRYVVDFYDLSGKRRKERFRRERDAKARLGEVLAQRETGELRPRAADIRVRQLVDDWKLARRWSEMRPNTRTIYGRMLDAHLLPALGERKLRTITVRDAENLQSDAEAAVAAHQRAKGGRVTGNLAITVLRILLTYAEKHGYVAGNVARHVKARPEPEEEERERKEEAVLTPEELSKLWNAADGIWRVFLMTVALTGLRKSEAMGLTWGSIDWASGMLHVRRQLQFGELAPLKTKAGYRAIAMTPELIGALKRWRLAAPKGPLDLVFPGAGGGALSKHAPDEQGLRPALRRAGLRQVNLHWLRHGYGAILISSGVSIKVVQVSMGHSSIQMTLDTYGHLLPGDHGTAAAALSRAFSVAGQQRASASGNFLGTSDAESPANRAAAAAGA